MNDLVMLAFAINTVASIVVFLSILDNNNGNFIKWIKCSFEERNWFGKLQICLAIIWMLPIIITFFAVFPIAWIISRVVVGTIFICMKIVDLGKK